LDLKHYLTQIDHIRNKHFFVLVEEAHDYVLGTTKFTYKAVSWYLEAVKQQHRWFNPAIYVCSYRPKDQGECSVPKSAVPILSSYSHLRNGISVIRAKYLDRFPNKFIEKAAKESW